LNAKYGVIMRLVMGLSKISVLLRDEIKQATFGVTCIFTCASNALGVRNTYFGFCYLFYLFYLLNCPLICLELHSYYDIAFLLLV